MRLRTPLLIGISAILIGLIGFVLIRYAGVISSLEDASAPEHQIANTDVNPYGANFFLGREVEPWKRERTVEMAKQAGLGWAKQQFSWAEIEPQRKGEFIEPVGGQSSWTKFDQIVDLYRMNGLQVIARLDWAPAWARPVDTRAETPPADFKDYGDFVYAFVDHFRGRVQYIQIWNEPNIYPEWGEQAVDPVAYTQLLKVAYERAKQADPNITVLSAPLASTLGEPHPEPGRWRSMPDIDYLEAMYEAGAGAYFDILSANAFGFDLPPDDPPDPDILNFRRVELLRQTMERYGDDEKAIWFNEYGWNAAPESFSDSALIWKRVSEEQQAEYTLRGIEYARENWPWAGVFAIWYFRQTGQQYTPDDAAYYFRMVDTDFTPRRVYDAVRDATASLFVAPSGHFEETHSSIVSDPEWYSVVAHEASGGRLIESGTPGASLTFTFQGHSVDLIARKNSEAGHMLVTLDGRNVSGFPADEQGRSYIDMNSDIVVWRARIPIASGLTAGQHVLRLTADDQVSVSGGVDAFEVNAGQPPAFPALLLAGLGIGLLAVVGLFVWDRRTRPRRERFF